MFCDLAVNLCKNDIVMKSFPLNWCIPIFREDSTIRLRKQIRVIRLTAQSFKIELGCLSKAAQSASSCYERWDSSRALLAIWKGCSKSSGFRTCHPCWCALFRWCSCFWVIHTSGNNSLPYSVNNSTNSFYLLGWNLSLNCCQCPILRQIVLLHVTPVKATQQRLPFLHIMCLIWIYIDF